MTRVTLLLLLLLLAPVAHAKGRCRSYTLTGTAYDKNTKDLLRGTTLMIGRELVTTDSLGHYTVTISGVTCDRGSRAEIDRCNEDAFGKLIVRRAFSTSIETIRSHWKRYAFCRSGILPCNEQHRILYVP